MGRGEGPRCYCYVNNLLRKSLDQLVAELPGGRAGQRGRHGAPLPPHDQQRGLPGRRGQPDDALDPRGAADSELFARVAGRDRAPRRAGESRRPAGDCPREIDRELAALEAERLPDVPQDDEVERAGAAGHDVFSLADQSPAVLAAVRSMIETLVCRFGERHSKQLNSDRPRGDDAWQFLTPRRSGRDV